MEYIKLGASGLNVSRLVLGSMGFGSLDWQDWVLEEQEALKVIQHAYEAGINTWDTADTYSHGRAEEIFGAALKKLDIPRHKVVILTKCGFLADPSLIKPRFAVNDGTEFVNEVGLSRKHIFDAVDASVKRLGTYIDVLQIHRFDKYTPGEEIMRALNDVIESGKVRYIGACSMAAWEFQMLQGIAERKGWHKFISMQNYYNLLYREEEREMIPYCNATGVGILPYSPLARGILAREFVDRENTLESTREKTDMAQSKFRREASQADEIIIGRVKEIAIKKSVSMATIALAWILARSNCCPVIGLNAPGRTMEALGALKQKLTDEEIVYLEEGYRPKSVQGH